mmetsp:Transcript_31951/g.81087  ORF Transcript_31951/g.81087 Transcript_31951/m.81087 type:complete len:300 (-) Transcript_31951:340-1239(-)
MAVQGTQRLPLQQGAVAQAGWRKAGLQGHFRGGPHRHAADTARQPLWHRARQRCRYAAQRLLLELGQRLGDRGGVGGYRQVRRLPEQVFAHSVAAPLQDLREVRLPRLFTPPGAHGPAPGGPAAGLQDVRRLGVRESEHRARRLRLCGRLPAQCPAQRGRRSAAAAARGVRQPRPGHCAAPAECRGPRGRGPEPGHPLGARGGARGRAKRRVCGHRRAHGEEQPPTSVGHRAVGGDDDSARTHLPRGFVKLWHWRDTNIWRHLSRDDPRAGRERVRRRMPHATAARGHARQGHECEAGH